MAEASETSGAAAGAGEVGLCRFSMLVIIVVVGELFKYGVHLDGNSREAQIGI